MPIDNPIRLDDDFENLAVSSLRDNPPRFREDSKPLDRRHDSLDNKHGVLGRVHPDVGLD